VPVAPVPLSRSSRGAIADPAPARLVTGDAPGCDYSRYCVWIPRPNPAAGGYTWWLKMVHGTCPVHSGLKD